MNTDLIHETNQRADKQNELTRRRANEKRERQSDEPKKQYMDAIRSTK